MPGWKYRQSRCAVCRAPAFFNDPASDRRLCSLHMEDATRRAAARRPAYTASGLEQPRIVTWADLERSVMPHIQGYDWAVRALEDLWRMSTPTPESVQAVMAGVPYVERRILLPSVFEQWWKDVQQRRGIATPLNSIIPVR